MFSKFTHAVASIFDREEGEVTFFQMHAPFTEPAKWNWGTLGWGTPNYFYSGTGAYLVRGSSVQKIIQHLRGQPANDYDAMLLSDGSLRAYEGWPHVFGLSGDAFHGPGLHGRKAMDEFDSGSKEITAADPTEPTPALEQARALVIRTEDGKMSLGVLGGGAAVVQKKLARGARVATPEHSDTEFDMDEADRSIVHRVPIKAHDPSPESRVTLRSPGQAALDEASAAPYGHPAWLQNCAVIYLDVGSNIGVQVRKLFEAERYPGAPVLQLFNDVFGAPEDRSLPSTSTGLCALGLEPNPAHREHLQSLQDNYTAKGWNVHFYPYAAWKDEGKMMFDEAIQPSTEDWGAKLSSSKPNSTAPYVSVRTVNLADFAKSLPPHSVKLMKVDIEGAEYETVWRMLQQGVLCQGTVDMAFFEAHQWGDVSDWKDDRTYDALRKHIQAADCGIEGVPTKVTFLDDESFGHDEEDVQSLRAYEVQKSILEKRALYMLALAACMLVFWLGYQKIAGGKGINKLSSTLRGNDALIC